jgi:hypothetical protein
MPYAYYLLHRAKQIVAITVTAFADAAIFIGAVLLGGLLTSWYMIDSGSALTTARNGPWVTWTSAGRSDADPYTRAHFSRLGVLQFSSEIGPTYTAQTDSDGSSLHSSCDYEIVGKAIDADWWSISVFNQHGKLISNPAERYAFTSDTIASRPDGSFVVTLSRDAQPGNWLPTGGAGRMTLKLTILEPSVSAFNKAAGTNDIELPVIHRKPCR